MDEGIGMDKLEGARDGQDRLAVSTDGLCGGQAKDRPKPFSSGQEAVTDGLEDHRRVELLAGEKTIEGRIDQRLPTGEVFLELEFIVLIHALPPQTVW